MAEGVSGIERLLAGRRDARRRQGDRGGMGGPTSRACVTPLDSPSALTKVAVGMLRALLPVGRVPVVRVDDRPPLAVGQLR
jgi:hypothetical protein